MTLPFRTQTLRKSFFLQTFPSDSDTMGKKRVKKEEQKDNVVITSSEAATKDIENIFSLKKTTPIVPSSEPKAHSKPAKIKSVDKANGELDNLEDVEKLVRAAKSKRNAPLPDIQIDDDFADIRGTKKRMHL